MAHNPIRIHWIHTCPCPHAMRFIDVFGMCLCSVIYLLLQYLHFYFSICNIFIFFPLSSCTYGYDENYVQRNIFLSPSFVSERAKIILSHISVEYLLYFLLWKTFIVDFILCVRFEKEINAHIINTYFGMCLIIYYYTVLCVNTHTHRVCDKIFSQRNI